MLELGYAELSGLSLPEVAQPHMEALNVSVHATRGTMAGLRRDVLPLARRAAEAIEDDLGSGATRAGRPVG